jgi:hypothetical protein
MHQKPYAFRNHASRLYASGIHAFTKNKKLYARKKYIEVLNAYNYMIKEKYAHPYKCVYCKREFKNVYALFAHLRFCTERKEYKKKKEEEEKFRKLEKEALYLMKYVNPLYWDYDDEKLVEKYKNELNKRRERS